MPGITLDATLATSTANSYCDVAYADNYWAGHWSATKAAQWDALNTAQKTSALISACRIIETARFTVVVRLLDSYPLLYDRRTRTVLQISYIIPPVKWYFYQTLQFPRNLDRDVISGALYIPENMKMAQCEQAVYLLNYDDSAVANRLQGVLTDSLTAGSVRLRQTYSEGGSAFAPMALEMARPFLLRTSSTLRRA